jgi:hypothetical protein
MSHGAFLEANVTKLPQTSVQAWKNTSRPRSCVMLSEVEASLFGQEAREVPWELGNTPLTMPPARSIE